MIRLPIRAALTWFGRNNACFCTCALLLAFSSGPACGHDGPPFPIVSDQIAGPYEISVWTDPDTTDDGSPGGQFWVVLALSDDTPLPPGTYATLTIRPLDREGPARSGRTAPVDGDIGRQFVALVMDHEGRFGVSAEIAGPRGTATVEAEVQATYDLRPPPMLLVLYALPFVAIAALWIKLLVRRRAGRRNP